VIKQVIVMESYFQSLVRSKSDTRDGATSVAPLKYKSGGLYIPLSDRGPTPPSVFKGEGFGGISLFRSIFKLPTC
jgi:hypothetical protein